MKARATTACLVLVASTLFFLGHATAAVPTQVTETPEPSGFGTPVVTGDIDGDGIDDLLSVAGTTVTLLRGSSTGTLSAVVSNLVVAPNAITAQPVVLDLDNDRQLDAVFGMLRCIPRAPTFTSCTPGSLVHGIGWARGHADGTFDTAVMLTALASPPSTLVAGDFTGDSRTDLAIFSPTATLAILPNTGGAFGAPQPYTFTHDAFTLSPGARARVAAEVNGDGITDIVLHYVAFDENGTAFNGLGVILGGPTPTMVDNGPLLSAGTTSPFGWDPNWVHTGDADGDGRTDLFVVDYDAALGQNLLYFHATSSGVFDAPVVLSLDAAYFPANADVQVGDLDGDGHDDIAYLVDRDFSGEFDLRVATGNGDGTFDPPTSTDVGFSATMLRLGDFDGDRALDIHLQHRDASFAAFRAIYHVSTDPDADHDGVLDVIDPDHGLGTSPAGAFDDGTGTTGRILATNGLAVAVSDAAAPDGVQVVVGAGSGSATITACGFTLRLAAASSAVVTCGSVSVRVGSGAVDIDLPGGGVAALPVGTSAKVAILPGGEPTVTVSAGAVAVTASDGTRVTLGTGPAQPLCRGRKATILGTQGADNLKGTDGPDVIIALGGNDKIEAGGGNDTICAGDGDDKIEAGDGDDFVDAGNGNDTIEGGGGNDTLRGGAGNDKIEGGGGTDTIDGGPGTDKCRAGGKSSPPVTTCE